MQQNNIEIIEKVKNIAKDMSCLDLKFDAYEKFNIPLSNFMNIDPISESDYYILYFDILGYKNNLTKYEEEYFLKIICAVMDTIETVFQDSKKGEDFGYHIFSDNIIIFVKKGNDTEYNANRLLILIKDAFIIQRNLMGQYRLLIRGAITEGKLYYGGDYIYGSGLINSYFMEDNIAVYPRIIIDKKCINDLESTITNESILKCLYIDINHIINKDDDDEFFVGYINCFGHSYKIFVSYLYYHKNLIESLLKHKVLREKDRTKILWCKKYHNAICDMYQLENIKADKI